MPRFIRSLLTLALCLGLLGAADAALAAKAKKKGKAGKQAAGTITKESF